MISYENVALLLKDSFECYVRKNDDGMQNQQEFYRTETNGLKLYSTNEWSSFLTYFFFHMIQRQRWFILKCA